MPDYSLKYNNKDTFVRIVKDYVLNIEKSDKKIQIKREAKNITPVKELPSELTYSLSGRITANDVRAQLANIKHIGFEVTEACNLKCTYCIYGDFYNNHDKRNCKQIDIRKAKLLIDFLVDKLNSPANYSSKNEVIISFYGGEPLLNMHFIREIVYYTQQMQNDHILFNYMMTTNAIYLKKYIDFLSQYNFSITVSLDGGAENNAYRKFPNGELSFEIVYQNIQYIQANYADYFKRKFSFNAVMHNLNNRQEVLHFFYHKFGMIPYCSDLNPAGVKRERKTEFEHLIREKTYVKDEKLYAEMERVLDLDFGPLKQLQHFIFHHSGNTYDDYNALLVKKEKVSRVPTATCFPFSKRIFMTVNNKIFPCEKIGHQYALGVITEDEVKIDCEYIAEKYNGYYDLLRRQCSNCLLQKNCTQCMFEIPNLENKPICDKMGTRQMLQEYLKRNMKILHDHPESYKRILDEIIIMK